MKALLLSLLITTFFMSIVTSCGVSSKENKVEAYIQEAIKDTINCSVFGKIHNDNIIIEKDLDLKGAVCIIPAGIKIIIKKGTISNGTIVGNNTQLKCKKNSFYRVSIQGSWQVPKICTKMFVDLSYENALRDVFALSNPDIKNIITIEEGVYIVNALSEWNHCLKVCSNTDLIIKGNIRLLPNTFKGCNILCVKGHNITITGNGTIVGDKHTHTGTVGEWGMGINMDGAINATVKGLTIKDCWGDCIYVGGNSRDVLIEKCRMDNGRRQGISVTSANGVTIRNCLITNVSGTEPEYAIDIEPNIHDFVDNILIENVTVKDCGGGFLVYRDNKKEGMTTPWIGNVAIKNCIVSCKDKKNIKVERSDEVIIEKCSLIASKDRSAITIIETGKAIVQNNIVQFDSSIIKKVTNKAKQLLGWSMDPIYVKRTSLSVVKDNKVVER